MAYRGSRVDGGIEFTGQNLASTAPGGEIDVISGVHFAAGGKFANKAATVRFLAWTKGAATALTLINSVDGTPVLVRVDSNILLEYPGIGSKRGQGIKALVSGTGSHLHVIAVPEAVAMQNVEV